MKDAFISNGFSKYSNLISLETVAQIRSHYDTLLADRTRTTHLRSDLGGTGTFGKEKITQLMRPSSLIPALKNFEAYQNATVQARYLLGDGTFRVLPYSKSGLRISGEVRDIAKIVISSKPYLLFAKNNESAEAYLIN